MYKDVQNQKHITAAKAAVAWHNNLNIIKLSGAWSWSTIDESHITQTLNTLKISNEIQIDGLTITRLDTTGIYFIDYIVKYFAAKNIQVTEINLKEQEKKLYSRVINRLESDKASPMVINNDNLITSLGRSTVIFILNAIALVSFFGQFCISTTRWLLRPLTLYWPETFRTIYAAGIKGLWVSSLLCFLIGVTLAYEMSPQFITYGANVYIVNFLGISLLKEVAPLLTAIIVAGRTGASITAEIGVMKVQEEIDALKTMGISPIKRLVLPKVIGVMIALPLITAIADIVSMLGGAIVANSYLGVNYNLFLERMQLYVATSNYTCGILKSIFFALAIALVGCFHGFNVKNNANSIGEETTNSVVISIVLVVCIDAIFAIIFKHLGL